MNPFLSRTAQSPLILASRSPRRVDILSGLGFDFTADPAADEVEDGVTHEDNFELPELLARLKRDSVIPRHEDAVVVAADTVVIHGDRILTKPPDDTHAAAFLRTLAGETHIVVTGVAVYNGVTGKRQSGSARTLVTFRQLSDDAIQAYVASGEGRDKAGAYAAQGLGASLIEQINGCYFNVVGLPVSLLLNLLETAGS